MTKEILTSSLIEKARAIKNFFPLLGVTLYEMCEDLWHSYSVRRNQKENLAELMVANHVLEKGITMPERRLGFGYERVRSIIAKCRRYIREYTANHIEIQSSIDILNQFYKIHTEEKFTLPDDIVNGIQKLSKHKIYETNSCFETSKAEYFAPTDNFKDFAHSRHSVRWYSDEHISDESLINAVHLAQTAPSACNRQGIRVYIITSQDKKEEVLKLQNGNRGFGHRADRLLLITADMGYWKCDQKTSAFLDAGIFTMNLLYALHYYKICACTLNAHLTIKKRKNLKRIVGYSASEIPVVFIAIGNATDRFMITGSQRVEPKTIYKIV